MDDGASPVPNLSAPNLWTASSDLQRHLEALGAHLPEIFGQK